MSFRERYGDWALIAGGSEGVGAELARELAAGGVNLVLVARRPRPLEALADELRGQTGVEVRTLSLDLCTPDAFGHIFAATDGLDVAVLVCNAGAGAMPGPFVSQEESALARTVRLNVDMPLALARHYGPGMVARGKGAMILVGSGAGECGTAMMAAYSAAKAFLRTLAEALWFEMRPHGIDVLAPVLGITRTPQLGRAGYPIDDLSLPGMAPREVALEVLARLSQGPVLHFGEAIGEHENARALPRRDAVEAMGKIAMAIHAAGKHE